MKGLIARKVGMTRLFDEKGVAVPVTVVEAGPCAVIDVRTKDSHGYSAVQLGFGKRKPKNVSKAVRGHCAKAGLADEPPAVIREIRADSDPTLAPGEIIKAEVFEGTGFLDVIGTVKGRGFQGVVKRYNFAGGRYSHGGGWKRKPGSIGQCEFPGRVRKNQKLPGQMGNVRRTIQNLKLVKIDGEDGLLFIKGAVPGPNGGLLIVRTARKKP